MIKTKTNQSNNSTLPDDETYWATKIRDLSEVLTELESVKQAHLENIASAYGDEKDVIEQVIKTLTPLSQSKTISKIAQIHATAEEEEEEDTEVIDLTGDAVQQTLQF